MARHYSTRSFFRQIPNALLARYFERQGVLAGLDWSAIKETDPEELFVAWLALPDEQRNTMDVECAEIFAMSCENGFRAIIDEARWHMQADPDAVTGFVETLSELPNHYHRAMVTYLDHGEYWNGATRFYHADTLAYWRKRKHLPHLPAAVDETSLERLADCASHLLPSHGGPGQ